MTREREKKEMEKEIEKKKKGMERSDMKKMEKE